MSECKQKAVIMRDENGGGGEWWRNHIKEPTVTEYRVELNSGRKWVKREWGI